MVKSLLMQYSLSELKVSGLRINEAVRATSHAEHDNFPIVTRTKVARDFFHVVEFKVHVFGSGGNADHVFERMTGGVYGEQLFWAGDAAAGIMADRTGDVTIVILEGKDDSSNGAQLGGDMSVRASSTSRKHTLYFLAMGTARAWWMRE